MLLFIANRKKISRTIHNLECLSYKLKHNIYIGSKHSFKLTLLLGFLSFIIFIAQVFFYFHESQISRFKVVNIFTYALTNKTRILYLNVYHLSVVFTYTTSTVTICVVALISFNVFTTLSNIIKHYRLRLGKQLLQVDLENPKSLSNITIFREIVECVYDVEETFNYSSLLLYGTSITWLFNSFNVAIVKDSAYKNALAYGFIAITFFMALVIFIMVTYSASKVKTEDDILKNCLVRYSENQFLNSSRHKRYDSLTLYNVIILPRTIQGVKLYLTGGGMFIISKGLILTVIGIMVTYGVILLQFRD